MVLEHQALCGTEVPRLVELLGQLQSILESTDPEARREWNETLEPLSLLLEARGLRGIGVGWETHR